MVSSVPIGPRFTIFLNLVAQRKTNHRDPPHHFRTHDNTTTAMFAIASALTIRPAVKVTARKAVKVSAFYDPDQYDHDANSGRGSGFVATRAAVRSSKASVGAAPTRVTRGADGVVYDPDQFDADANQRSGGVAVRPAGAAAQGVGSNTKNPRFALLFDCDGVIVETEELHRKAYNASFKHFGLVIPGKGKVEWSVEYYDVLANTVGGGNDRVTRVAVEIEPFVGPNGAEDRVHSIAERAGHDPWNRPVGDHELGAGDIGIVGAIDQHSNTFATNTNRLKLSFAIELFIHVDEAR